MRKTLQAGWKVLFAAVLAATVAACGSAGGTEEARPAAGSVGGAGAASPDRSPEALAKELRGEIRLDGSSTVYPIAQAAAEEFMNLHKGVNVTVGLSGSSNGIKAIINGEADIANSSRKIKDSELEQIRAKGDDAVEMPVAYDGITVVIHPENDWAEEMTVAELKKIWAKDSTVKTWADVREGWPDEPITLLAPGAASGTFEYFTEAVNGEAKAAREDVTASEDDNVLVRGVAGDKYAMSYFGYAYYEENKDKLKAVRIKLDENAPAVAPSLATIGDFSYAPLSRFIYMYPLKSALKRPEVAEFVRFLMSDDGSALAGEVGYVPLDPETRTKNLELLPE